ncbi:MAG: adenylyltransferase/cytidyltransferase family protein [Acidimicrobiales bacterium]|nr:adenylyltransferase/cytidyltransferase family protein [Acidimicrobiales bacterium]
MSTIVTFGTFDLFHIGHLRVLERAAELGTHLTVGISTDELNEAKKGYAPVYSYEERSRIVAALGIVDEVFAEETLEQKGDYLIQHGADALVMGSDWEGRFDEFRSICEVVYLPRTPGISTSALRRVLSSDIDEL